LVAEQRRGFGVAFGPRRLKAAFDQGCDQRLGIAELGLALDEM